MKNKLSTMILMPTVTISELFTSRIRNHTQWRDLWFV